MKEQIIAILEDVTGIDNITEDMSFGTDIILTSITVMKMVYDLEDKLKIKDIPVEMMYDIETVKDLINIVEERK